MVPREPQSQPRQIIPFPAAAIRRVYEPAPPEPAPPAPVGIGWIVLGVLVAVTFAGLALFGTTWLEARRVSRHIERIPSAMPRSDLAPPAKPVAPARGENVLVAGLDGDGKVAAAVGGRSDAIMVFHLDADRAHAWVVSVPRDAWVTIPGRGENMLNAAFSLGGAPLFVRTLETLTGLSMDHLVVIDWTGFRRLTDALGGVPLSLVSPGASMPASTAPGVALEMSGGMALEYVSERHALPAGDFDRVRRQQRVLRALFVQAHERRTLSDVYAMRDIAAAVGDGVRVDAAMTTSELLALMDAMRRLRLEDVTFLVAPVAGSAVRGDASVARVDEAVGHGLWSAMAGDSMPQFVAAHPDLVTPADAN